VVLRQTVALVQAMCWDTYWLHDNEGGADQVCKEVSAFMKLLLSKHDDAELGLGATAEPAERAQSREALYVVLKIWQKQIEVPHRPLQRERELVASQSTAGEPSPGEGCLARWAEG
jgi:hypothetical protein